MARFSLSSLSLSSAASLRAAGQRKGKREKEKRIATRLCAARWTPHKEMKKIKELSVQRMLAHSYAFLSFPFIFFIVRHGQKDKKPKKLAISLTIRKI